jgi:predicted acyltransferase
MNPETVQIKGGNQMTTQSTSSQLPGERLVSLDFFRGLTMFLLIGESTHLYSLLRGVAFEGTWLSVLGWQLEHHEWNGLHFWDLVQPFFMFIVGVAMPFAFARRTTDRGLQGAWGHALWRSFMLLVLGVGLYCISAGRMTFELWNVLAQLSFTYLVAFMIMHKPAWFQIAASLALILLSEILYRAFSVPGFNQPFTPDHNFGSWVDYLLMGKLSGGHWVAFNAVPTAAHTIWGAVAGQWLRRQIADNRKVLTLLVWGVLAVVVGYALDPVTPIIKRICTSSFVIVSGGWCLVALALSYYIVDVKKWRRVPRFFTYVGMNSLFIYLFCHTDGAEWITGIVKPFTAALLSWSGEAYVPLGIALVTWLALWALCYGLYRRKLFFKL